MPEHVIIDGNNLLFAMYEHAPMPHVGRETLVRVIERWAETGSREVTLVFDGPDPQGALGEQLRSPRLDVLFSAPHTADDIIIAMVHETNDPGRIRVVSGDKAIRAEAVSHRCRHVTAIAFVAELFPPKERTGPPPEASPKPLKPEPKGTTQHWLETFGFDDSEPDPFDGHDAMRD